MDPRSRPARSPLRPTSGPAGRLPSTTGFDAAPGAAFLTAALLAGALLAGCDTAEPALRVAGVAYDEEEILDYGPSSRRALGAITAVGVAVSSGDTLHPAAPLLEARRREALVRRMRDEALVQAAGADDAVLRTHYRTNPERELTVRHLVVLSDRSDDEAERARARSRAEAALERIRGGEPFAEVAGEVSEEPGAERRGGLLEPGREGTWVDEFWRAASLLEPGEVSDVVETEYGFHVLRLEALDTVPFEEARPRVVREVASLLPADPAAAAALEDSVVGAVEVHGDVLARWLEAWDPWQDEAGEEWSCPAPDAPPVASWSAGALTHCDLRRHLATLPYGRWREALGSPEVAADEVEELAREVALARAARERGLEVPARQVEEVRRAWLERMRRWAAVLGFERRMPPEALRATALSALGSSGQELRIVRDEIRERIPLLLHAYEVRFAGGDDAD